MHLHTIVKVRANSPNEAIEAVNELLAQGDYGNFDVACSPFDYFDEEATAISEDVTNEEQFQALREQELLHYKFNLEQALKLDDPRSIKFKATMFILAGEALDADLLWSTDRIAYDYTEGTEGNQVYYVETDRHF